VKKSIGFHLEIKPSRIPHHDAGDGVFLHTATKVNTGTLLGFCPGVIYNSIKDFEEINMGDL